MKLVRTLRTLDLRETFTRRPYIIYSSFCVLIAIWGNYTQWSKLRELYVDWDEAAEKHKVDFNNFKLQELNDIRTYNNQVDVMRQDLKRRREKQG